MQGLFYFKDSRMFCIYVLRSLKGGRLYKGLAKDVDKRLVQHNNGENKSTKGFVPWILVYQGRYETRPEARAREKYLKSGSGREFLRTFLTK